jgi:hypothetical protein
MDWLLKFGVLSPSPPSLLLLCCCSVAYLQPLCCFVVAALLLPCCFPAGPLSLLCRSPTLLVTLTAPDPHCTAPSLLLTTSLSLTLKSPQLILLNLSRN